MDNFDDIFTTLADDIEVYTNVGYESFMGISYNENPNWNGWKLIEEYRRSSMFPSNALNDENLILLVKLWYKEEYWNYFKLNKIIDRILQFELFQQAVKIGKEQTTKHIQEICNILNYKNIFGNNLLVNGEFNNQTEKLFLAICNVNVSNSMAFTCALHCLLGAYYIKSWNVKDIRNSRKIIKEWLLQ